MWRIRKHTLQRKLPSREYVVMNSEVSEIFRKYLAILINYQFSNLAFDNLATVYVVYVFTTTTY